MEVSSRNQQYDVQWRPICIDPSKPWGGKLNSTLLVNSDLCRHSNYWFSLGSLRIDLMLSTFGLVETFPIEETRFMANNQDNAIP